jgi:Transglycosylase
MQRRWLLIGGAGLGLCLCALLFFLAVYGHVGAWIIRSRVVGKLEARLGRTVEVGDINVRRGLAVLEDVVIKGPHDQGEPLARIARVEVEFAFWPSLVGSVDVGNVAIEGVRVTAVRSPGGDNFGDLVDRLRGKEGSGQKGGGGVGISPDAIMVAGATIQLRDLVSGLTLVAEGVEATAKRAGGLAVNIGDMAALSTLGPYASVQNVVLTADSRDALRTAAVAVGGGEVHLWRGMVLTGVNGRVAQGKQPGRLEIELSGGYGGAQGTLWRASGWLDPRAPAGSLLVKADRFTFDRIASVLENSMVRDFDKTSINAELSLDLEKDLLSFKGQVDLSGLNVFDPALSEEVVRDISFRGHVEGSYDRAANVMKLDRAQLATGGVNYELTGAVELAPGGMSVVGGARRRFRRLEARLVIPPVPCQKMLDSIPGELIPHLVGFKLGGTFATDVFVGVDWADLKATKLGGSIGIRGCKVKKAPEEMDATRLEDSFEHEVEVAPEKWQKLVIGPENPDFVPLIEVSPYLVKSLMTTEDSSFYRHRGFITREFRTALIKNLEAGRFRYGASSISMQMVKNVLLYRDKTLARKLQELFLTWYLETKLEKDRILEIYLNAIEYGPGLYGIKPAAMQYFGKLPIELGPTEAAFFSSILPSPKRRYKQFCKDKLTNWTIRKVERILAAMYKRERLTEEELQLARMTPLVFQPDKSGDFCTKKYPEWGIK